MEVYRCFSLEQYQGRFVPMIASHSLVKPNNNITTAIISIHGLNENAMAAYDSISTSVNNVDRASGEHPNNVLVVVPWFHRNSVHSSDWNPSSCQDISPSAQSFAWSANSSWVSGGDSILLDPNLSTGAADYSYVSSFGVLDDLYTTLTKPEMFPSLRHITYVGFSAGGQMINRYAWATEVGQVAAAPDVSKKRSRFQHTPTASAAEDKEAISYRKRVVQRLQKTDVSVRFIVSDASSYVYFDNFRPDASCRAALDSGPLHHCDRFAEHTSTWCGQFNTWKYGTVVLPGPHDGVSYVNAIARGEGAVAARTEQYRHKDIRYVFGEHDSCNCRAEGYTNPSHCYLSPLKTYNGEMKHKRDSTGETKLTTTSSSSSPPQMCFSPSAADAVIGATSGTYTTCCDTYPDAMNNDLSTSCGSNLQGSNRLQRGLNYMYYLQDYYRRVDTSTNEGDKALSQSMRSVSSSAVSKPVPFQPVYQIVPYLQHDLVAFYAADIVQEWLFVLPEIVAPSPHRVTMRELFSVNTLMLIVIVCMLVLYLWFVRWWFVNKAEKNGRNFNGARLISSKDDVKLNNEPNEATALL